MAMISDGPEGGRAQALFNPLDPPADPYLTYARLRDEAPLHFVPLMGAWVISRHADVQLALRDPRFGRDPASTSFCSQARGRAAAGVVQPLDVVQGPARPHPGREPW